MMAIVFVSRLLPFVSFDVNYAAGLTPLKSWRFGLATLAGIIPTMSFLLAHFGSELSTGDLERLMPTAAGRDHLAAFLSGDGSGAVSGPEAGPDPAEIVDASGLPAR